MGLLAARLSQGEARVKAAAAAKSDAPNADENPSTDSIKPGRCCVPHSWFAGARRQGTHPQTRRRQQNNA